jgi:hypothetical protein
MYDGAASCMLASTSLFVTIFSSPVLASHVPTIRSSGFPIWHLFMPSVVLVLPNPHTRPHPKKKVVLQLPGNNHQSTCQEPSLSICDRQLWHRIRSQVSKTGLCISSVLPFRLLTWPPINLEFNRFLLADRVRETSTLVFCRRSNAITRRIGRGNSRLSHWRSLVLPKKAGCLQR